MCDPQARPDIIPLHTALWKRREALAVIEDGLDIPVCNRSRRSFGKIVIELYDLFLGFRSVHNVQCLASQRLNASTHVIRVYSVLWVRTESIVSGANSFDKPSLKGLILLCQPM